MAWTAPRTWTTLEVLTAGLFNTHIRDNLAWVGTDHPRCIVSRSTPTNFGSGVLAGIPFNDADTVDVGAMHSPSTNNTRVTIPTGGGGFYHFSGSASWTASSAGRRHLEVRKNGTDNLWVGEFTAPPAELWRSTIDGYAQLAAGDYIELCGSQDSGITLQIAGMFAVEWRAT